MPVVTVSAGEPLIVGALIREVRTWIENAGSATLTLPSFTLMTMFEYVPTLAVRRRAGQAAGRRC